MTKNQSSREEEDGAGQLATRWEEVMTASSIKHYSGHHKDMTEQGDQKTLQERHGEINVDSRLQVWLEKEKCESTRKSWMQKQGVWPILH